MHLFHSLWAVNPTRWIAFPKDFSVCANEVDKWPSLNPVGFGVLALIIPKNGMLEISGFDHAPHDGQGLANALVDLDRNETSPGILLLPPDQMGS